MRGASWNPYDCARPGRVLDTVDVEQQLALEDVGRLVVIGVEMQRSSLATACRVLKQNECVSRLLTRHLEGDEAARKPEAFACFLPGDCRHCTAHHLPPYGYCSIIMVIIIPYYHTFMGMSIPF